MLHYVTLCYVMLCYVMLCYVMLCYVMLYCVHTTAVLRRLRQRLCQKNAAENNGDKSSASPRDVISASQDDVTVPRVVEKTQQEVTQEEKKKVTNF